MGEVIYVPVAVSGWVAVDISTDAEPLILEIRLEDPTWATEVNTHVRCTDDYGDPIDDMRATLATALVREAKDWPTTFST